MDSKEDFHIRCTPLQSLVDLVSKFGLIAVVQGICNFEIYLGKKHTIVSPRGLYHDVVMSLTKHMRSKNHFVFMDNLYSSVPLFLYLSKHSIYVCSPYSSFEHGLHVVCCLLAVALVAMVVA